MLGNLKEKKNDFDASGVARGCGWQHLAAYVNLATFYLIGLPISCLLGFKTKLHAKVKLLLYMYIKFLDLLFNMP